MTIIPSLQIDVADFIELREEVTIGTSQAHSSMGTGATQAYTSWGGDKDLSQSHTNSGRDNDLVSKLISFLIAEGFGRFDVVFAIITILEHTNHSPRFDLAYDSGIDLYWSQDDRHLKIHVAPSEDRSYIFCSDGKEKNERFQHNHPEQIAECLAWVYG